MDPHEAQPRAQVLTASWTTRRGVQIVTSDLPDAWTNTLLRLGRDLRVRHYGGSIEQIDWAAEYEAGTGGVLLRTAVTVAGRERHGLGMSGAVPQIDDDEESITAAVADLVQDQVARAHVAWPWGDWGGFMSPRLEDSVAVWLDNGRRIAIGAL
ncbi:hypothetical protein CSW57_11755 [Williamsia muralis]|uniref:Uncharacterized protein n=1 Tax=Williamsia marianensis TaxID=85044 RepID=A0A2G3PNI5_WILMA|nr:hypothetical protein CSW57_11755 [Williamsia marianensis]